MTHEKYYGYKKHKSSIPSSSATMQEMVTLKSVLPNHAPHVNRLNTFARKAEIMEEMFGGFKIIAYFCGRKSVVIHK